MLHPEDLFITPGVAGALLSDTVNDCAPEVPQLLLASTVTIPPVEPVVAMIVLVVDVPVQPFGSVQIYEVAPLTGATVKVSRLPTVHTTARPVILPGVAGAVPTVTTSVCIAELPHPLLAFTVTLPPLAPIVVIMELVVDVPVQPFGSVQVYEVAPLTGAMEKVSALPGVQPEDLLVMAPGVAGTVLTTIVNICAAELPQLLLAFTVTLPPLVPAVVWMTFVVDVPVQPFGSVHVYEVAPLTGAMEKVSKAPLHKVAVPLIAPGVAGGVVTVTVNVCAEEVPQLLPAVTETVPPTVPAVAIMIFVDDVPVQPFGSDQV